MDSGRILFDASLMPNRPLPPRGLFLVVGVVALTSFSVSLALILHGAWPVTPFFGADVALLGWALHASAKASRRSERVTLTPELFTLRRFDAAGHERAQETLGAAFLRVEHDDPERMGCELTLVARGRRLVLGSFLGANERASLADALRGALRKAREP